MDGTNKQICLCIFGHITGNHLNWENNSDKFDS